jgi:hypothetical protein
MNREHLLDLCTIVRNAIESVKFNTTLFKDFPMGSCRDSSIIIGMFLRENGCKNLTYCHAQWNEESRFRSHAWLEYENYIIDITADQFGIEFSSIIVSRNCDFSFYENSCSEKFDLSIAGADISNLFKDYEIIKTEVKRSFP